MPAEIKKRIRLSREERREMILDCAAELVAREGVSGISMDNLGRSIEVSKSLVYAYFPSMNDVLQAVLEREYRRLRKRQKEAAEGAETIEQLVRRVTHAYLGYIEERGLILDRLAAEPYIADHDPTAYGREVAVRELATLLQPALDMDLEFLYPVVDISFGLPAAAGHYLTRHDVSLETVEDITVTMILGSIEAIQKRYRTAFRPLQSKSKGRTKAKPRQIRGN